MRHWYSESSKNSIRCYALYVLTKYGEDVSAKASQLFKTHGFDKIPLEALGWLLVALKPKQSSLTKSDIESIIKHLKNKVNETAEVKKKIFIFYFFIILFFFEFLLFLFYRLPTLLLLMVTTEFM